MQKKNGSFGLTATSLFPSVFRNKKYIVSDLNGEHEEIVDWKSKECSG